MTLRSLLLELSNRPRVGQVMERLPVSRRLVRGLVAGPAPEDALVVLERVNREGLLGAVTYLRELARTPGEAAHAAGVYLHLLDEIKRRNLKSLPSLKPTQLGLGLNEALCLRHVKQVLGRGLETGTRVWIDMEGTAYTDRTLDLFAKLHESYPNVACVVQASLRRTERDVERLVDLGATFRLCKGAYREPPALAYADTREIDASYARLVDRILAQDAQARSIYVGFATHDERLIRRVRDRAAEQRVGPDRFEIQMLYGIRPDLHQRIREWGLTLRLLVPFGEDWYGYFMRRLAERPATLGFLLRNLARS